MKLLFEPPDHERYLRGLRECFPEWGDRAMYDWCFARTATGPAPERMVFADDAGDWIAGTAISFRTIRKSGKRWLAGVMTGSWTLPAARGQGIFPRFIQETRKRVAHHGGVAVLGFAGDPNRASTRKLAEAGSRCVSSTHGIGDVGAADLTADDTALADRLVARDAGSADAAQIYARWQRRGEPTAAGGPSAGFAYDDEAAFAGQYARRALPLVLVRSEGDAMALIESATGTDRVLFLDEAADSRPAILRALWARAARESRTLFTYAVGEAAARPLIASGLRPLPGYFTILPAGDGPEDAAACDELKAAAWDFQAGDRM